MTGAPLRIGVLGAARIVPKALIEPARGLVEIAGVAARDRARATAFAESHGVVRVYDDYQALIESPDVDAVYIGLPCSLHFPWALRALSANKDVLCEKPLTLNAEETRRLVERAAALGRLVMEAHHWRYHPLAERVRVILASGVVGRLRRLRAVFDAPIHGADDIRWQLELGGGALMDLGCYTVQWLRLAAGTEGRVVWAEADEHPPCVDRAMRATLAFPRSGESGLIEADLACSMHPEGRFRAVLTIEGEKGTLVVDNPVAPHDGHELLLTTTSGERRERVSGSTTYRHQLEAFVEATRTRRPPLTGGGDAIATATTLDAIYRAAGLPLRGEMRSMEVLA